jgi:hypothetical protein
MSIKVESEVKIYEVKHAPVNGSGLLVLTIASHWNDDRRVVISFPNEGSGSITVLAADLIAAIKNATNTNRY